MKELTTEQKAKAYDEAIEKLRSLHDDYDNVSTMIDIKEELKNIFPELKESEDEKIRKELIRAFKSLNTIKVWNGIERTDILAWLEKQGEQKSIDNLTQQEAMDIAVAKCFEQGEQNPVEFDDTNEKRMFIKALERVEEQNNKGYKLTDCDKNSWWEDFKTYTSCNGEKKPTDKVELKFNVGDTVKDLYGDLYHITEITNDSYKTDDGRFILFKNQEVYTLFNFTAWSEEDEHRWAQVIGEIEAIKSNSSTVFEKNIAQDKIDWLKSLKDRVQPQPKQAWCDKYGCD